MISEFEQTNERQSAFCQRRELKLCSFRMWLYKIRGEAGEQADCSAAFVPLVAATATCPSADGGCRLKFGAIEIAFAERPPAQYLVEILRSMTAR